MVPPREGWEPLRTAPLYERVALDLRFVGESVGYVAQYSPRRIAVSETHGRVWPARGWRPL